MAAGLVLCGLSLAVCAPATAAGGDSYVLVTVNGEPVDVEGGLASVGTDVSGSSYTLCQTDGSSTQLGVTGWSVETVLKAAGVSAGAVSSVSIPRIAGSGSVTLHPADYDPTAAGYRDFPEGPAVLVRRTVGADSTPQDDFFRPSRAANCADDPNGPDYVRTPNGSVLEIDIASGTQLEVSSTVDHSTVSAGQPALFAGSVANPPAGATLNYRWHFGDGTVGTGASVSHVYAGAGSYTVTLTADSGASAGGAAAPLTVVVGSAAGSAGPAATASPSARPRAGATASARHPAAAPSVAHSAAASAPVATAAPTAAGTTATARTTATPSAHPAASATAGPVVPPVAATRPTAAASSAPPVAEAGTPVSGRLITLTGPRPPAAASSADPASAALVQALGPHGTQSVTAHRWGPYAAVAALVVLLGAGALAELRASRQNDPR